MKKINLNKIQMNTIVALMLDNKGVSVKELRQINKICDVVEKELKEKKDDYVIEFEDEDFKYLKKKFQSYQNWNPKARKIILDLDNKLNI